MTDVKPTPGPWTVGTHLPRGSADGQPAVFGDERRFPLVTLDADDLEAPANARLIAAAPDLLEACRAALLRDDVADCELGTQLRAAIAKAEGRDA